MDNVKVGQCWLLFAVLFLCFVGGKSVFGGCDGNCPGQAQIDWIISMQDPITGLVDSYQDDGKVNAYIFDQALAIIALTDANRTTEAQSILNRMRDYQRDDPNGAWYVAYRVGIINPNWPPGDCQYYRTGDIAWMVIAINFYEDKTADANYAPVARKALGWMDTMMHADDQNDDRYGALRYSNTDPCIISTEHNIDAYSAYYWRGILDSNDSYLNKGSLILDYLRKEMWAPSPNSNCDQYLNCNHNVEVFWRGYNDWSLATDCQAWAVLSLGPQGPEGEKFDKSLCMLLDNPFGTTRNVQDYNEINDVDGFRAWTGVPGVCDPNTWGEYSEDPCHIWVDGTEHVAAAFYSLGDDFAGDHFHNHIGRTIDANGGLVHSFCEIDPNIFRSPENDRYNYVASAAWYYFNEVKINPLRPSAQAWCRAANINKESFVNFEDFDLLARDWLQNGSGLPGDIYLDGSVDSLDLKKFAEYWLCGCAGLLGSF